MRKRQFGPLEQQIPIVGQGTWKMDDSDHGADKAEKALKLGIELGMTHIDTAEMYGNGSAEEIISQAIQNAPRESLFIVSKVLPSNASFQKTIEACDRSLKRLGIDYLDCYLLHWRGSIPIGETMRALEKLVDDGKIRSLGVSNFDVEDLEEAQEHLQKHPIVCNQVLYHLGERGIERALMPYCKERNIAIVGYTPFGSGRLPGADTESGAALHAVARKHDASPRQIILAFLTRHDGLFTIPKASEPDHVRDNAAAGDLVLSDDDIAAIDTAFPAPKRRTPLAWA